MSIEIKGWWCPKHDEVYSGAECDGCWSHLPHDHDPVPLVSLADVVAELRGHADKLGCEAQARAAAHEFDVSDRLCERCDSLRIAADHLEALLKEAGKCE